MKRLLFVLVGLLLFSCIAHAQSVSVYYVVTSVDAIGDESSYSNEASCLYDTTHHHCLLNWNASTSTVSGYNIYRGSVKGGPYVKVNTALVSVLNYTDAFGFPAPPTGVVGTPQL